MIWTRKRPAPIAGLAAGQRIYAMGDIHGRLDLLDRVLDRIDADSFCTTSAQTTLVFLGDYVDRGPKSRDVIQRLIEVDHRYNAVFLKGNHESLFLSFLESPGILRDWAALGGLSTLVSYGLSPSLQPNAIECDTLSVALREVLPPDHLSFLRSRPLSFQRDGYFFVHAGIRPHVPLASQKEEDLLWIRDEFLLYTRPHERIIVHGHTPTQTPDVRNNRINIDTGAYATGNLTCLVLEGETRRFL